MLDTDTGIDDAVALILALKSKELMVEAVTMFSGNVMSRNGTRNTFKIEIQNRNSFRNFFLFMVVVFF